VEHSKSGRSAWFFHLLRLTCALFCAVGLLTSCDRPLSEPELHDPIYLDMAKGAKEWERATEEAAKKLEKDKEELAQVSPKDPMRKRIRDDVFQAERNLERMKEKTLHEQLLLQKRKEVSRAEYARAREAKAPWPNKEEYEGFKAAQRLRAAPRNWDERVPKLKQSGMPNPPPPPPPEPPKN
jgi:hypothetical protein